MERCLGRSWSFPEAPLWRLPPRRFEEHEDSRNRTLEIADTVGFIDLRVLRGENSRQLQEKTMERRSVSLSGLSQLLISPRKPQQSQPVHCQ